MHYTSYRFVFFTSELPDVIYLQILTELSKKTFAASSETVVCYFVAAKLGINRYSNPSWMVAGQQYLW